MPELATHYSPIRGCIHREKWGLWGMGPYAGADYDLPESSKVLRTMDADECFPNYSKLEQPIGKGQGVTKRYRLSWLTNSALVYEPNCGGGSCGVSANEYSGAQAHGA